MCVCEVLGETKGTGTDTDTDTDTDTHLGSDAPLAPPAPSPPPPPAPSPPEVPLAADLAAEALEVFRSRGAPLPEDSDFGSTAAPFPLPALPAGSPSPAKNACAFDTRTCQKRPALAFKCHRPNWHL
eukprot:Tamp_30235.p2 GENE.Tamp_30235~~Tamp_30235.p2  ORF type:complete len:127 (-),score=8.52 Tamp_30235:216-596(-)